MKIKSLSASSPESEVFLPGALSVSPGLRELSVILELSVVLGQGELSVVLALGELSVVLELLSSEPVCLGLGRWAGSDTHADLAS